RLPFQANDMAELIKMQIGTPPQSPHERDKSVPEPLSNIVMNALDKDASRRPPSAGAFAARLRAVAEGEIALLRKAKDAAHTHTNCFLPILFVLMAAVMLSMIPVQFAASRLYEAKVAPVIVLGAALDLCEVGMLLFVFQLYKAACTIVLRSAAETGQFRPMMGPAFRTLLHGLPSLVATQLRSALDLR